MNAAYMAGVCSFLTMQNEDGTLRTDIPMGTMCITLSLVGVDLKKYDMLSSEGLEAALEDADEQLKNNIFMASHSFFEYLSNAKKKLTAWMTDHVPGTVPVMNFSKKVGGFVDRVTASKTFKVIGIIAGCLAGLSVVGRNFFGKRLMAGTIRSGGMNVIHGLKDTFLKIMAEQSPEIGALLKEAGNNPIKIKEALDLGIKGARDAASSPWAKTTFGEFHGLLRNALEEGIKVVSETAGEATEFLKAAGQQAQRNAAMHSSVHAAIGYAITSTTAKVFTGMFKFIFGAIVIRGLMWCVRVYKKMVYAYAAEHAPA